MSKPTSALPVFTILGATGLQGSSVLRALHTHPTLSTTFTIRALTRTPTSARALSLLASFPSITLFPCDLNSAASTAAALAGSHTVFAVTDFWAHGSPATELAQGRHIAAAAQAAGVAHLVWSSLPVAMAHMPHFSAKAAIESELRAALPGAVSVVVAGWYVQNLCTLGRRDADGTLVFEPAADMGRWVMAVVERGPRGGRVAAFGEWKSLRDVVEEAGGRVVFEEAEKGEVPEEVAESLEWVAAGGYFGGGYEAARKAAEEGKRELGIGGGTTVREWIAKGGLDG
ncbi:hypothetical protein EDC01DRAFT_780021 [Geopyxis carbonaria]|nr:hypothetical protein EDC01DRAFT_780021 [Geopyxis carbonaria]